MWLTQKQMAELFGKDRRTITRHIQNIYKDEELEEKSVCSFFEHTAEDKKTYTVQYYNLDMIISVGYRVNSKRGIAFRKWATNILKDYMLKGYAVNQKRLEYLEKTIKLIDIATRLDEDLRSDESYNMLKVVKDHIFVDGNKRIGATLFLYFLNFYGLLRKDGKNIVEPETLVAITLFVAQSNSKEKDVVIDLLMNILMRL